MYAQDIGRIPADPHGAPLTLPTTLEIPIQVLTDETGDIHEDVQRQLQGRLLALHSMWNANVLCKFR